MSTIGSNHYTDHYLEDIHVTENEKGKEWYLKDNIDYWIANLVRSKPYLSTYRNYYNGVRDQKEFAYLTENFGIGSPSSLNFTPLIKPRIDALLSQIVSENLTYRVTCVDNKTVDIIGEDKKMKKVTEIEAALTRFSQSAIKAFQTQGDEAQMPPPSELASSLKEVNAKYGKNYLSEFEIAAQNVLKYFESDYRMDLKQKLKQLALDLLVTGECHYRVIVDRVGADPHLQVIKPENIYYNKNTNSQYFDTVDAIVHREYLTRKDIMAQYGKFMDKEQREYIFGDRTRTRTARSLRSGQDLETYYQNDDPLWGQKSYTNLDVVEVFTVEWLALNEVEYSDEDKEDETQTEGYQSKVRKGWRVDRYEGTRIAGSVYVNSGKSSHIVRSESRPYEASLTFGGVAYNDRNGRPYSMVGAMKDIQDVYDLTLFYRDNLIANSGVAGDRINIAGIPKALGNKFMERLYKFIALKKNGFELIDPTEPGAQMFQHYGSFDNSVNGQSLVGINTVLEMMEKQADLIAGVNKQMLGQIAERDAVGNVKTGIQQSLMINQDLFEIIRTNQKRLLQELLNAAKIAYQKGKRASYIAGSQSYIFEIIPAKFCMSDFALNITYSSKDNMKLAELKILAKEYASNGMVDPDVLTNIILSESITDVNRTLSEAVQLKKLENDQLGQAQQQLEQMQQQMKEMEGQLQQAGQKVQVLEKLDLDIKQREITLKEQESRARLNLDTDIQEADEDFQDEEIGLKKEIVQLEREQLYLGSGAMKEPKNFD